MLLPVILHCAGIWILTGLPCPAHIPNLSHVPPIPNYAKFELRKTWSGKEMFRKSGTVRDQNEVPCTLHFDAP